MGAHPVLGGVAQVTLTPQSVLPERKERLRQSPSGPRSALLAIAGLPSRRCEQGEVFRDTDYLLLRWVCCRFWFSASHNIGLVFLVFHRLERFLSPLFPAKPSAPRLRKPAGAQSARARTAGRTGTPCKPGTGGPNTQRAGCARLRTAAHGRREFNTMRYNPPSWLDCL
jgi:hypothetical protein